MPRQYDVCWTKTAERDLEVIIDYIACDSAGHAQRILEKLRRASATQSATPLQGRVVPELLLEGTGYAIPEFQLAWSS
jgi:plasmid stabilization system protein ParE